MAGFLCASKASAVSSCRDQRPSDESRLGLFTVEEFDARDEFSQLVWFCQLSWIGCVDIVITRVNQNHTDVARESSRKTILPAYSGFHKSSHDTGTFSTASVLTTIASGLPDMGWCIYCPGRNQIR